MKQMKVAFIALVLMLGCKSSYEMVRTGPTYPPLPKDTEIKVIGWQDTTAYEQIAIVDVAEYNLERRMNVAKQAARDAGGSIIMPKLSSDADQNKKTGFLVQSFLVLKERTVKVATGPESAASTQPDSDSAKAPKTDYSTLPRAQFRLLLSDISMMKGEKFRGSLYPIRFYRVPPELKSYRKANTQLLMLSSRSGTNSVLVFLPEAKNADLRQRIQSKKILNFVYTPLAVYKSRYPVLEYIDEIRE